MMNLLGLALVGFIGAALDAAEARAQWWNSQSDALKLAVELASLPDLRNAAAVARVLNTKFDARMLPPISEIPFPHASFGQPPLPGQPDDSDRFAMMATDLDIRSHVKYSFFTKSRRQPNFNGFPFAQIALGPLNSSSCLTRDQMRSAVPGRLDRFVPDGGNQETYYITHYQNVSSIEIVLTDYSHSLSNPDCFRLISVKQMLKQDFGK